MKCKVIAFLLVISNLSLAQIVQNNNTSLILKLNVTALIDVISFPTVQISAEKRLSRKISLSAEVGYQLYSFKNTDTTFLSPEGYRVNIECRYYFLNSSKGPAPKLEGAYLGLRPFYRQNQYNSYIPFQIKSDNVKWYNDEFGAKNRTYGVSFIIGIQKSVSRKLIFDLYSGLGVVSRKIENTDLQYNKDSGDKMGGTNFMQFLWTLNLSESSGLWVSIPLGFRIGYKF